MMERKKFLALKKIFFYLCVSICFFVPGVVLAAGVETHEFSLEAIDYDYLADQGTGDPINDGDYLEPGQVFQVDIIYSAGEYGSLGFQYALNYDNTLVEPIKEDGSLVYEPSVFLPIKLGGPWPASGTGTSASKKTNWTISVEDNTGDQIRGLAADSKLNNRFAGYSASITTLWFKVKETAPAGSIITFDFSESPADTFIDFTCSDAECNSVKASHQLVTNPISFKVFGEMSADDSLKTLTLTGNNGLNYLTDPAFTPGTSTRKFKAVVPNSVSSITVGAEATDEYAKVLSGGLGSKNLSVGENTLNLTVQTQNGNQEIYEIKVYRLSNDTSLKTLDLSDVTLDNALTAGVYTYTATVPYATSNTTISAETTHQNAVIKSGTGAWNLTNTGDTLNTKNISVEAEDCDTKYASVPGNACTSKNYVLNITRIAPSSINTLSDIKIDGVSISDFRSDKFEYVLDNAANDKNSINVTATLSDTKATLTGGGNKTLNVGDNTITLTVVAEDKTPQDYVIKVRRLSNNANLATLNVTSTPQGNLTPNFTPTFDNYYTYTYDSTVNNIDVTATKEHTNSTILSGTGSYSNGDAGANVVVQAEDGTLKTYVIKFSRNSSSDATLKSLSVDGYNFNETFHSNTTLYTVTVPGTVDSINVSALVNDSNARIESGTGSHDLNYGSNTIQVRVRAENNATKDYTITVTREKKDISTLTDLTVDGTTVSGFKEDTLTYDYGTVPFDKKSVTIGYTKKDNDATVTGTGTINLTTGDNTIPVTVLAHNGTTKTVYSIHIFRTLSDNAYLKSLSVSGYPFTFDKETNNYTVEVPYETTTVTINAAPEYAAATVLKDGPTTLSVGNNNYTIAVTAENGEKTNVYNLKVIRKKSTNTYLSNLTVTNDGKNYLGAFNKETTTYNIRVDNDIDNVDINAILAESINQTVSGDGHKDLSTGLNTFEVIVTAANGDTKTYTINITRALNGNNKLSSLQILDHTLSPTFTPENTSYTLTVDSDVEQVVIQGEVAVDTSTVTGLGTHNLRTGTNTINIDVTSEDNETKTYTIVVTKKASHDSTLKSLSIQEALLNETFVSSKTNYTVNVQNTVDTIHVAATPNDTKATVTGTGEINLKTGNNEVKIIVTAEDNTTKTYTIIVDREKSHNAYLTNITLSNGYQLDQVFNKEDLNYTLSVPNSMAKILVTATKEDEKSTVRGAGEVALTTGSNEVKIIVTAEDGYTTKTYKLTITRALSNNTNLKSITSTDGVITPDFSVNEKNYTLTVPYEVENVNLAALAEDTKAIVSISGNTNLSVGVNHATIIVTAENGDTDTYYVDITRQPSSNNFLSSLKVVDKDNKNYIDVFNKTERTYNITVDNSVTSIDIQATAEDNDTTVRGTGSKNLNVGSNSFTIESISADGTPRTYTINITRSQNNNTYLSSLSIDGQTLVPDFSKEEVSYSLNVSADVTEVNIRATAEESTTTVTGTGNHQLRTGLNTFNIKTQAQDGSGKTYVISINKAASSNKDLGSLLASEPFTPAFDKDTLTYQVTVPNATTSIDVQAVAADANANVEGNGTHRLEVGDNSILIKVTAEDNTFKVYTIEVHREASNNNYLKDLKVNNQTINGFNKENKKYTFTVANSVTQLDILGVVEDSTASISGNKKWDLQTGFNTTDIVVTAQNGDTKVYTLEVTREMSDNNYLSKLETLDGSLSPAFDKNILEYTMEVPYEITSLRLRAEAEDISSDVEIEGNVDFQIGDSNIVYISVVAENNDVKKYQIRVTRLPQANNYLSNLTITSSKGTKYSLSPSFDKNTLNYTVNVDASDNMLTIDGTKEASSASVTGFDTIQVASFPATHKIVVTSAGGVARTYSITFNKVKSNNANLKELNISNGTLSPAFDENILTYNVTVDSTVDSINISALGYEGSSIIGDGPHSLDTGNNQIQISVTAEDGSTKNYTINVEKKPAVDTSLKDIKISGGGTISPAFKPELVNYLVFISDGAEELEITPSVNDPLATLKISINDGPYEEVSSVTIDDVTKNSDVKIKVENGDENTIYTIAVLLQDSEKITSETYGHVIEDEMIKTIKVDTTATELKDQLDNDNKKLKIYQKDGKTEYTGNKIATGMIVKLFINNVVVDQKTIVVVGDTDGTGAINAIDALKVVNHIIETEKLTGCYLAAAETTKDNTINAIDALKIINHIIGNERLG